MERRVVITGLGLVSALGVSLEGFWKNLLRGKQIMKKASRFDSERYRSKYTTILDYDDVLEKIDSDINCPQTADWNLCSKIGLFATTQALRSAKFGESALYKKAGISLATTSGGEIDQFSKTLHFGGKADEGLVKNSPIYISMANIAEKLQLEGPVSNISSACTSGAVSIIYAYELVKNADVDIMLAGGCDVLQEIAFAGFNSLRVVTPDECRPFSKDRAGMIIGDGAAVLVLEEYESARKRNAPILAEIKGIGLSCDAYHATAPNAKGATQAMQAALRDSGFLSTDIHYVNCHGTGTIANDRAEAEALNAVFGDAITGLHATSTKSCIGHLLGTAGSIEAIITILVLTTNMIPPMINFTESDDVVKFRIVRNEPLQIPVNNAMSNSFGFGGNNASIILSRVSYKGKGKLC